MRYVTFVFVTLLLHAGMSMAQNGPPASIGLAEGNPSAVDCPSGQYLAGFNIWTEPQIAITTTPIPAERLQVPPDYKLSKTRI
jgi:hypothetical protein